MFAMMLFTCLLGLIPLQGSVETTQSYFTYSAQEKEALQNIPSDFQITQASVDKLDVVLDNLEKPVTNKDGAYSRLKTYFYIGQNEAAALSLQSTSSLKGSLDPLILEIVRLFLPSFQKEAIPAYQADPYSEKLASIVMGKLRRRFEQENQRIQPYPLKTGEKHWKGKQEPIGLSIGNWKPWILNNAAQFRAPPPPPYLSPQWKKEMEQVRTAVAHLTADQKERVIFWNGTRSPREGNWFYIAADYMKAKQVPVDAYLQVRAELAMVNYDAMIAVFDSKYIYAYPRPINADADLKTPIKTPDHPSYPSGHSTASGAFAAFLSQVFPENAEKWRQLRDECGHSRIWAGLHYPMDHKAGVELGTKIGEAGARYFHQGSR